MGAIDDRIKAAVETLHRHLDRSWRVEELAARVHLSASRFAHLFRAEMGVSPARYVKTLRLVRCGRSGRAIHARLPEASGS